MVSISPKLVFERIAMRMFHRFQLYTILLEAKQTKPGYKTHSQLEEEMEIARYASLEQLLRMNQSDKTIKMELVDNPEKENERMMIYSILPKGEKVLAALKELYKACTGIEYDAL